MARALRLRALPSLLVILTLVRPGTAPAASSTFTYQGQLKLQGTAVTGTCDLQFKLFDGLAIGAQIGPTRTISAVPLSAGLFSVQLDFGAAAFPGADRWLEIAPRCPAGSGTFTALTPRQPVTAVPYAIRAMNANALDAPGGGPANALLIDNAGQIGIGTNAPASKLDVRGQLTLESGGNAVLNTSSSSGEQNRYLLIINSPTTTTASGLKAGGLLVADDYGFANPGKNNLVVKGNLGIGASIQDGDHRLKIDGGDRGDLLELAGNAPWIQMSDKSEGGLSPALYRLQAVSGHLILHRRPRCTTFPCPAFAPMLSVLPNGSVGIGTTTPTSQLEVVGNGDAIKVIGFEPFITFRDTNPTHASREARIQGNDGHLVLAPHSAVQGDFSDAVVVQNNTGNLGVGTSAPEAKLDVVGRARVGSIEITGGGDLAEPFRIAPPAGRAAIEPGMVVVIDPDQPGALALSTHAYDRRAAGVISGAKGLSPGLVMAARGDAYADGDHPVALTGRVWTHCDARKHPIEPGDLLTTSDMPGHAMRVGDHVRAQGAVLGKAMTRLARGETGLVLTLVSLQ